MQTSLLNIVMQLKKLCNHSLLMSTEPLRYPDMSDPEKACQPYLDGSGKLHLLDRMLRRLKKDNHRVLIFSQVMYTYRHPAPPNPPTRPPAMHRPPLSHRLSFTAVCVSCHR